MGGGGQVWVWFWREAVGRAGLGFWLSRCACCLRPREKGGLVACRFESREESPRRTSVASLCRVGQWFMRQRWYPAGNDPHEGDLILESEERAWKAIRKPGMSSRAQAHCGPLPNEPTT